MRHLRKGKKLGRVAKQRKALYKTMTVSLIEHGRIRTTLTKAKALKPFIEKAVTRAKEDNIHSVRILRKLFPEKTTKLLTKKWAPLFKERTGGYTRIIKLVNRQSDASPMAYLEFVERPVDEEKKKKTKVKGDKKKTLKKEEETSSEIKEGVKTSSAKATAVEEEKEVA